MPYILKVVLKKHHFDKFCLIAIEIFRKMKPKKNGGDKKAPVPVFPLYFLQM